jgi:DNA-binding NtrC family response regulator
MPSNDSSSPEADGAHLLVVDDDVGIVAVLKTLLQREGYVVSTADNGNAASAAFAEDPPDIVLMDILMTPRDGISVLEEIRRKTPDVPVIMMTGHASVESAIKAMKLGAFDYICKPFNLDELLSTVQRALSYEQARLGPAEQGLPPTNVHFGNIVGESPKMRHLYDLIEKVQQTDGAILVLGESGTGKQLVARALHDRSSFADGPFVSFNCVEYPERLLSAELFGRPMATENPDDTTVYAKKGALQAAQGGTLHIDGISGLTNEHQETLLAELQGRPGTRGRSDCQLLITDTEPLERKVNRGEFQKDLYYRLNITCIEVPPLRERSEDVSLLVQHFVHASSQRRETPITIDSKALRAMENYSWPGNVRELESAIIRAANISADGVIHLPALPAPVRACYKRSTSSIFGYSDEFDLRWWSLKQFLKDKERDYVAQVLKMTEGNRERAAEMLGISVDAFNEKYAESQ